MGKATIISGENARYTIQVDTGSELAQERTDKIDKALEKLREERTELDDEISDAEQKVADATQAVNDAIAAYRAAQNDPDQNADSSEMEEAARKLAEASGELAVLEQKERMLKTQITSLEQDRAEIQKVETVKERETWCADATLGATGEVATIEVPGEPQDILIAPGAPAPTAANGYLAARALMSPHQAYYNAAILPGWQRHKPQFMAGTITELDTARNLCTVEMDAAESSAQGLSLVKNSVLGNVPIEYMTCNAGAFAVDDHVVIDLRAGWDSPKVIGFMEEPKTCCFWPTSTVLPEAGESFVVIEDGYVSGPSSNRLYTESKGDAEYSRTWPESHTMPDRWSYDDELQAFHYSLQYDSSSADGSGVSSLMNQTDIAGHAALSSPMVRSKMRINYTTGGDSDDRITVFGSVTFDEVGGDGRAFIRVGHPTQAGAPTFDDTGEEFVDIESSEMAVVTQPTTEDPLWRPVGALFQCLVSSQEDNPDIEVAAWFTCLRVEAAEEDEEA